MMALSSCAEVNVPDARNVKIPSPVSAEERKEAINERPDSVMYLPLGADILVPERTAGGEMPSEVVGPFELRSETLAGALQLILADYDVAIAFETDEGLTRKVTVANLKGPLGQVVSRVCSLADLYCLYEENTIIVKDTQTFAVTLPPLAGADGDDEFIGDVVVGLSAILGEGGATPVSDPTTRTIVYSATQRTSKLAEGYFQRLRANTAMIVFETYIWEVSLDAGNSTGVNWDKIEEFGKFGASIDFSGSIAADFTNPVSIGLPTTQSGSPTDFVNFLSQFGAVKTISQPQITVLSGSQAELRVADTENYVSEVSSTVSGDNTTTSVSTDSVDSGFTLSIGSSWDRSTVYANVSINLTNVVTIDDFAFDTDGGGGQTTIQLPQTTERELTTQIRVRPGDSVLIAGLVREVDNFDSRGLGFMEPILPDSRTVKTDNLELVILLRPRVIVYTSSDDARYLNFIEEKKQKITSSKARVREGWLKAQPRKMLPLEAKEEVKAKVEIEKSVEPAKIEPVKVESIKVKPVPLPVVQLPVPNAVVLPIKKIEPVVMRPVYKGSKLYVSRAPDMTPFAPQPIQFTNDIAQEEHQVENLSRVINRSVSQEIIPDLQDVFPGPRSVSVLEKPSVRVSSPAIPIPVEEGRDAAVVENLDVNSYRPPDLYGAP
jgi:hypothetical protein